MMGIENMAMEIVGRTCCIRREKNAVDMLLRAFLFVAYFFVVWEVCFVCCIRRKRTRYTLSEITWPPHHGVEGLLWQPTKYEYQV